MRPFCFALLVCVGTGFSRSEPAKAGSYTVTLLHFSDYHSHALPFYDDGREGVGGIARAIGYLRQQKKQGALVFSGGDMVNRGSPAWSDKYQCAEWPWLNGIVDAMAFGNHDADYGREAFDRCRAQLRYPILSANTAGLQKTAVLQTRGARIGVFALAGPDFPSLVKAEGFTFNDRIAAARDAVRELREQRADAIVMIGHEHVDDDYALARAVPGIDVIFGSHSHLKRELTRIDGTNTWFISPGQYLSHVSRVELTLECGGDSRRFESGGCAAALRKITGKLVPIDRTLPLDRRVARRVIAMQKDLERDPQYAALFAPIGTLKEAIGVEALGRRTVDVMRSAAKADVALSTASSFRQALPPGVLTLETLRAALPYDNEIVVAQLTGAQIEGLLADPGADGPFVVSWSGGLQPAVGYRVALTDYLARIAKIDASKTGLRARDELRKALTAGQ